MEVQVLSSAPAMKKVMKIGVKALFLNKNKVLLIKRSGSTEAPKGVWDIPGGRLNTGEEPDDGLKREVEEEIGVVNFKILRPIQVKSRRNDSEVQIIRITYLCEFGGGKIDLSHEHVEFDWFDLSKLPKKVDNLTHEAIIQLNKN